MCAARYHRTTHNKSEVHFFSRVAGFPSLFEYSQLRKLLLLPSANLTLIIFIATCIFFFASYSHSTKRNREKIFADGNLSLKSVTAVLITSRNFYFVLFYFLFFFAWTRTLAYKCIWVKSMKCRRFQWIIFENII